MKTILLELKTSILLTLVFAVLLCGAYPLLVWGGAQLLFPTQANGSLVRDAAGTVRGSALLAQNFSSAQYFHPRPSAAGTGYDATNSGGTNLGPTSQKLNDSIKAAVATYRTTNGLGADTPVPADAVTSSGSGLDPHISLANAHLQAARVARSRGLSLARVLALIADHIEGRDLRIFGDPGVNVLLLNRSLDAIR
ncbi:MAG: K(+)-transporting ATPase subunit C [Opitutaceae bacterium]